MRKTCVVLVSLGLLCLCPARGGATADRPSKPLMKAANEEFREARSLIADAIAERSIVSAAVGVAHGGKIIWLEAFGLSNGPQRARATAHTAYPVASVTKPMTATAIMLLAERGKIDINDPVEEYIKPLEFKAYGGEFKDVTLKHLLNHTSGLPMHYNYFYVDEPYDRPSLEETVERYGFLMHPPGAVFRYSNLGYGVLGHVISKVSDMTYEEFMQAEVFERLGMTTSWVGFYPDRSGLTAEKYGPDLRPIPHIRMDSPGAGEAFSCAYDLVRFGMFHLKNNIPSAAGMLSREAIEAMQRAADETAEYEGDLYGMGWFFREDDYGYRTVWHEGGIGGASSIIKLVPSENIAVVVLLNSWSADLPGRIANEVIGVLLPDFKENMSKGALPASSGFAPFKGEPEFTGTWKGDIRTYAGDLPVYMVFQEDGDVHFLKRLEVDRTWVLQNQNLFDKVLNNTGIRGNRVYGWVDGRISTPDAMREPHVLVVDVVRAGDKISGSVSAISASERMYYGLSHYVELEKQ